jgi:hypothetical protein
MVIDITVFYPSGPQVLFSIPYASQESASPGTWHWMKYQLGQAQYAVEKQR